MHPRRCRPAGCPARRSARAARPRAWHRRKPVGGGRARRSAQSRRARTSWHADLAAAVDPGGLKREVFGFLPYWELTDSSTRLDWEKLSTIAYFGVGAAADGTLQKTQQRRLDDGRLERLDELEDDRASSTPPTRNGARVVLTVQSFAWSSSGRRPARRRCSAARPIAPPSPARSRPRCAIEAPTASTSTSSRSSRPTPTSSPRWSARSGPSSTRSRRGLPADVRRDRLDRQLPDRGRDRIGRRRRGRDHGLRLQERLVEPVPARSRRSADAGYDIGDTIKAYVAAVPASKVILGVPVLRPCLVDDDLGLRLQEHLERQERGVDDRRLRHRPSVRGRPRPEVGPGPRAWPGRSTVARTARPPTAASSPGASSTTTTPRLSGSSTTLDQPLRPARCRDLGARLRRHANRAVRASSRPSSSPTPCRPSISAASISSRLFSPNGDGRMDTATVRLSVTGHIRFGWIVQRLTGGTARAGAALREPRRQGRRLHVGRQDRGRRSGPGRHLPDHALDRRRLGQPGIGQQGRDDRPTGGRTDPRRRRRATSRPTATGMPTRRRCRGRPDERISGTARLFGRDNATVRRWTIAGATAGSWVWNGKNAAGKPPSRTAATRCGWSASTAPATRPRATCRSASTGPSGRWHGRAHRSPRERARRIASRSSLRRKATVTVAIYQGTTLGPADLDGPGPGGRHVRLDLERQDGRRRVRQARELQGRRRRDQQHRAVPHRPQRHRPGSVARPLD